MKELDRYLKGKRSFSGSVLITQKNEVLYTQSFGYAHREQSIKNTLATGFAVGGLTKLFTAVAILQLVERGLLEIHQPLEFYFPGLYTDVVRIVHLLCHTSGIPNYPQDRKLVPWDQAITPSEIVARLPRKLHFSPGSRWAYSCTNYLLLGLLIQQLSGLSYHHYIQENIFKPAEMKNSGFMGESIPQAQGFVRGKPGPTLSPVTFAWGDLVTSVDDLARFQAALFSGKLLRAGTVNAMMTPDYNGRFVSFGYGWFIKHLFGRKCLAHSGSHPQGFSAHMEKYFPDDITIIVASNNHARHGLFSPADLGATFISRSLAQLLFGQSLWFWDRAF